MTATADDLAGYDPAFSRGLHMEQPAGIPKLTLVNLPAAHPWQPARIRVHYGQIPVMPGPSGAHEPLLGWPARWAG